MARKRTVRPYALTIVLLVGIVVLNILGVAIYVFFLRQPQAQTVDVTKQAKQFAASCGGQSKSELCYASIFYDFTKKHPMQQSLAVLHALQSIDPSTNYCHLSAHKIAIAEVEKDPAKWLDVLAAVDIQACSRGFFHGVIEAYSSYHATFTLNQKTIPQVCDEAAQKLSAKQPVDDSKQICVHAAGHVLLVQENADVAKATAICDKVPEDIRRNCYDGVFMEDMSKENLYAHGLAPGRAEWSPSFAAQEKLLCDKYSGAAANACWSNLGQMYGVLSNGEVSALHTSCQQAATLQLAQTCEAYGAGLMGLMASSARPGIFHMTDFCSSFRDQESAYQNCIVLVVPFIVNSSPAYAQKAAQFCSLVEPQEKEFCLSRIDQNNGAAQKLQSITAD